MTCRDPVRTVSVLFVELAAQLEVPIVPVGFSGGLPVEPLSERIDLRWR